MSAVYAFGPDPTGARTRARPGRIGHVAVRLAIVLAVAACSQPRQLGPADGHELPPVDTGRVAMGDTAPDFTLRDLNGEPVTLSALRGRPILLVFYRGHW